MKTDLYYFSGTGNSLNVARAIQKRIPNVRLVPTVTASAMDRISTDAENAGLVFPVHALSVSLAVKRFLRRVDISSARYIFAVATRLGLYFNGFRKIDALLKKQGKQLQSHFLINMPGSDVKDEHYKPPSEADLAPRTIPGRKSRFDLPTVKSRACSREKDSEYLIGLPHGPIGNMLTERLVVFLFDLSEHVGGVNYFYADEKFSGCGICGKVCLSGKVEMETKNPTWNRKTLCHMCYACVNFCPDQAVQIRSIPGVRSFSYRTERHPHPYAAVNDIAAQKVVGSSRKDS